MTATQTRPAALQIVTYSGEIFGVADVLFNAITQEELDAIDDGSPGGKKPLADRIRQAEQKVRYTEDGHIHMPGAALKKAICEGATKGGIKNGRASASKLIEATVFVEGGQLVFDATEPTRMHEHWGRIPPKTGAVAKLRRPMLEAGWRAKFRLQLVGNIHPDTVRKSLESAGLLVGIGAWRPEHGRFVVTSWERAD